MHSTVQRQTERLGRHCLLFQHDRRARSLPVEALVLDGFRTFEFSQYWPCDFNLLIGKDSRFLHGFTDAELRRSGRMRPDQRARREHLEALHGRPDPRATEREVEALLRLVVPRNAVITLWSDEHPAYLRAIRRIDGIHLKHRRISSRAPRTPGNPLFPVNSADLMLRHSSANHRRETIAFSRRRQAAAERLAVFQVWRNFMRPRAERRPGKTPTPAMCLGLARQPLPLDEVLGQRLFPTRVLLPERLARYYRRDVPTRQLPRLRRHALSYAS